MKKNQETAVIIGAGPAGLTAAYELLKKSEGKIHPIVLEMSKSFGGISRTIVYKHNRMDIGGHRFFTKSDEVKNLWHEILPLQGAPAKDDIILKRETPLVEGGPDPEKTDDVMLVRHRISRILYLHKFFDYPISIKWQTFKNMGFSRTMKAGFGYLGSVFHKRKEQSLADFYVNRFGKPLYQMFFEDYTEKVWGRNPKYISPDWGSQRVKGLSLGKALLNIITKPFKDEKKVETSLIEQFEYPKLGPGHLYERMADKILKMGGEIHTEERVTGVTLSDDLKKVIKVTTTTKDGERSYTPDYVISSMPLKDLYVAMKQKEGTKAYEVATTLIYRDFITVGLLLKKLKIQNETKTPTINNIVPDTWIYVQEREVKLGRLQIFNNWSPYLVDDVTKHVWIGLEYFATEGDELWSMKKDNFIKMAIDELCSIQVIDKEDVIDAAEEKVEKAYPAYFDSYKDIAEVQKDIDTISNLYCIGRNGQHRYNNMDHSMLTAIETVKTILNPKDNPKEKIWLVNTEKDYAETTKA